MVLLFAGLAERAGRRELRLATALPCTVADLEVRLRRAEPALEGRPFRLALNRRYATAADPVQAGDEIALIPPVSGG